MEYGNGLRARQGALIAFAGGWILAAGACGGGKGTTAVQGSNGSGGAAGSAIAGASGGAAGTSSAAGAGAGQAASGPPTFSRVWNEVILPKGCTGVLCHGGGQGNLMMTDMPTAYMNLVNAKAAGPLCGGSSLLRVKPGDPDASLLLDKLSHMPASCGETMPIGTKFAPNCVSNSPAVCTTEAELGLVRDWISQGAGM